MALTPEQQQQINAGSQQQAVINNLAPTPAQAGAAAIDANGSTPSPYVPNSGAINRSIDSGASAAENFLNTFTPPQTADQIAEGKRQTAQGQIDAINKVYDDQLATERKAGDQRLAQTDASSVLSGLMGSTEAGAAHSKTTDANDKAVQAVNN